MRSSAETEVTASVVGPLWRFEAPEGADAPWQSDEEWVSYKPRGPFLLGLTARGGVILPLVGGSSLGGWGEIAGTVELRPVGKVPLRFGLGGVLAFQSETSSYSNTSTGIFGMRLRAYPLIVDLSDLVTLRVGGDIGFQHLANIGDVAVVGGALLDVGLRFLEGQLEIGLATAFENYPTAWDSGSVQGGTALRWGLYATWFIQ